MHKCAREPIKMPYFCTHNEGHGVGVIGVKEEGCKWGGKGVGVGMKSENVRCLSSV